MGNRAVITTEKNFENNGVGVYLHWNGGYDSVSAFLKYCGVWWNELIILTSS